MVIVTGTVQGRPDTVDQLLEVSLAHVRRSRQEPGCLHHAVHRDAEDPLRLVFLEQWSDTDALRAHFQVPESGAFVRELTQLSASSPEMTVYEAEPLRM